MATVSTILDRTMRILGVLEAGATATADEVTYGLLALNSMLMGWAATEFGLYVPANVSHSVPPGTGSLTIGSGADIDTTRPRKIFDSYIRDSAGQDHVLPVKSLEEYGRIGDKDRTGRPRAIYPRKGYADWTIYFDRVTDATYTLKLELLQAFTSYTAGSDDLALPEEYEEAITYNLAIRLAPEFGAPIPGEVGSIARKSFDIIRNNNAQPVPATPPLPFSKQAGRYDINTD